MDDEIDDGTLTTSQVQDDDNINNTNVSAGIEAQCTNQVQANETSDQNLPPETECPSLDVSNDDEQIISTDEKISKLVLNLSDRTKYTKEVSV